MQRGCSITGGYVVRDSALPGLSGRYVYGDDCSPALWSISLQVPDAQGDTETGEHVSNLYLLRRRRLRSRLRRLRQRDGVPADPPDSPSTCPHLQSGRRLVDRLRRARLGDLTPRPTGKRLERGNAARRHLHRAGRRSFRRPQLPSVRPRSAVRAALRLHDGRGRHRPRNMARELHAGHGHLRLRSARRRHERDLHSRGRILTSCASASAPPAPPPVSPPPPPTRRRLRLRSRSRATRRPFGRPTRAQSATPAETGPTSATPCGSRSETPPVAPARPAATPSATRAIDRSRAEANATGPPLGRLETPDHAAVGRARPRPVPALRRVHLARLRPNRRPQARVDLQIGEALQMPVGSP